MALYIASGQLIAESPLFGYGMEQGGPLLDERAGIGIDRAHNEILQWGIYGGVPAMLLYVAGLAMLAVRQLRRLRQLEPLTVIAIACCAEYLCSSLFGVVMITTAPYFWMFVGFAAALPAGERAGKLREEPKSASDTLPDAEDEASSASLPEAVKSETESEAPANASEDDESHT